MQIEKINFNKSGGLVPTIIQDYNNQVISLVYSNKESLTNTIETKKVWRYSREQQKVIQVGSTSGNYQELISIKSDCDNDTLIFRVKLAKVGCHTGTYTCFGDTKQFSLQDLYAKICSRINDSDSNSYTRKLLDDNLLLKRKLIEESAEVITAKNREELVWECSDLIYFLFVIMAKEGITIEDIENENLRRDK
jgi:phosphoribosyl-ATP pyrophosphohydrolase/phosphoribosyl-AMP cyclohydrolase